MKGRLALAAALALAPAAGFAETREIWSRLEPVEVRTGIVRVSTTLGPYVDLPVDCDDGALACTETTRLTSLIAVEFALETSRPREDPAETREEERGRVLVGLSASETDADRVGAAIGETFTTLRSSAFELPFAGQGANAEPWTDAGRISTGPTWACFDRGDGRTAFLYARAEEGAGVVTRAFGQSVVTEPVCGALARAVRPSAPAVVRSRPEVVRAEETTLRVEILDRLRGEVRGDALAGRPLLAETSREAVSPDATGASEYRASDGSVEATVVRELTRYAAVARRSPLTVDDVRGTGWLARWTLETVERQIGHRPARRVVAAASVRSALLPAPPPDRIGERGRIDSRFDDARFALRFDPEPWLERIAREIGRFGNATVAALANLVSDAPAFGDVSWVQVVCFDDGSAFYRLLPTTAEAPVENAGALCSALAMEVDASE